jgi:cyclopropane-fatty-acyl-phospholipid synthase
MMTRAKHIRDSALEPNPGNSAGFEKHGTGIRAIGWAESGRVPDWMIRAGIRRLNRQRLAEIKVQDREAAAESLNAFAASMAVAEVAPVPHKANEQHYEVPPEFFQLVLGEHRKYSCAYWPGQVGLLDEAEEEALRLTCEHAGIVDGMDILELGCGWGSLTLWIGKHYPNCKITAVSNSAPQREFITAVAREKGLDNVNVVTSDMNDFTPTGTFDRVVSVEMFEHMRNYPELFRRISTWLNPGGRFFMHIFCHRLAAYEYVDKGPGDWMSRHFFTGGIMPSADLPLHFQQHLGLESRWLWDGRHYEKTANAWLENMDRRKADIMPVLRDTYGADQAGRWFQRWRIFFMACAELFGTNDGQEWMVGHYLFHRQQEAQS